MQELRVTEDKHEGVELCSPVGLHGTKSKGRATCKNMALGSQTNNVAHSLSGLFCLLVSLCCKTAKIKVIQPELHIFKVSFCSIYVQLEATVGHREEPRLLLLSQFLHLVSLCQNNRAYTVQLRL